MLSTKCLRLSYFLAGVQHLTILVFQYIQQYSFFSNERHLFVKLQVCASCSFISFWFVQHCTPISQLRILIFERCSVCFFLNVFLKLCCFVLKENIINNLVLYKTHLVLNKKQANVTEDSGYTGKVLIRSATYILCSYYICIFLEFSIQRFSSEKKCSYFIES